MKEIVENNSYIPLIALWEEYLAVTGQADVENFASWVLQRKEHLASSMTNDAALDTYFDQQTAHHQYAPLSSEASFVIWRLSKFIRYYTRPVLAENGLAGQDDFAILAHVDYRKSCSKKEAILANIIELTTGVEIIKRLIKQGLMSERPNPEDGRERLISLTEAGSEKLYSIYRGFTGIQDVMADMTVPQREQFIAALKKLDDFHTKKHSEPSTGMSS